MGFKLKAGALQLTIFISIVIGVLLGAFILYIQLQNRIAKQHYYVNETINNSQKGILYSLKNNIPVNDSIALLTNDDKVSIVSSSFWGMFTKITSEATIKNFRFKKVAFIGAKKDSDKNLALQLSDFNKPLVLVGKTKIQGNVLLPKQGVKTGYISGIPFYGEELINGNIAIVNKLPQLSSEKKKYLKELFHPPNEDSDFINRSTKKKWQNSFKEKTKISYSKSDVSLEYINIQGNIKIQSATKITIAASATLIDVILVAPRIEIKAGVTGNFQAIASDELIVEKEVTLNYPSVLLVVNNSLELEPYLQVGKNTHIDGALVYLGNENLHTNVTQLFLDDKSVVIGEVYCNKNIELLGSVFGTVYVANFIAKQSGSIYLNHIYNGAILIDELPDEYVGISFKESTQKGILKWMY